MQVLLDGVPIDVPRPSVALAIQTAAADAVRRGRIVIEVKADGVALTGEQLSNPADEDCGIRELSMLSADPRLLVQQTVLDAADAVESVRADQASAAEMIQTGRANEALDTLQRAFITWQAARDVVARGAALLSIDLDRLALPGVAEDVSFASATTDLLSHLTQLKDALNRQDWSALADIVAYDLDADAQTWHALLTSFATYVKGLRPGTSAE
jgi:hypothetical protein